MHCTSLDTLANSGFRLQTTDHTQYNHERGNNMVLPASGNGMWALSNTRNGPIYYFPWQRLYIPYFKKVLGCDVFVIGLNENKILHVIKYCKHNVSSRELAKLAWIVFENFYMVDSVCLCECMWKSLQVLSTIILFHVFYVCFGPRGYRSYLFYSLFCSILITLSLYS